MDATAPARRTDGLVSAEPVEPFGVLDAAGVLAEGHEPGLGDRALVDAWRLIALTRIVSARAFSLQRQGRLGTTSTPEGQEAAMVGSALALDRERDWIAPTYRELPALLHMGLPLARYFLYYRGHPLGANVPEGVNALPIQISLATQIPHAVGLAWALQRRGTGGVVVCYFGEGAASEGDAHEAMNLAGVLRAPVIFLLQDNGWAISTPAAKQSATPSFALRALGYGFPGELVDGNDILAVHDATSRAVERARAGLGPTLIEARTYRLAAHNTADDPTRYVDAAALERAQALDPLSRLTAYLRSRDLLDDEAEERVRAELREEVEAAVAAMEAEGAEDVGAAALFDHVYAEPPERLRRQREAFDS